MLCRATEVTIPGIVWLTTREHHDSFADLPDELAASYGGVVARIERAILALGDIARVHVYRWGDGSSHFHIWFYPRPLGMLEARREMLPLWADLMPEAPTEVVGRSRAEDRRGDESGRLPSHETEATRD